MADDVVIRAEGLGKKYVIGHEAERERYTALARRDRARRARRLAPHGWTWRAAARIVAGDSDRGVLGAQGRQLRGQARRGARHHRPQRRRQVDAAEDPLAHHRADARAGSTIKGRVASLLEVGTGFHPELTGRENIYLNGAILGMTRAEIRRKFDEIVAFAEVEKFLDTPVKRYSSGMYVRLAFAVAAHLEPEILVVDEVLAVGDAEFQKKCLGKMGEVAGGGRTVLFVSHNMSAVETLCPRSMYLESGALVDYAGQMRSFRPTCSSVGLQAAAKIRQFRFRRASLLSMSSFIRLRSVAAIPPRSKSIFGRKRQAKFANAPCWCTLLQEDRIAIIDVRESGVVPFRSAMADSQSSFEFQPTARRG